MSKREKTAEPSRTEPPLEIHTETLQSGLYLQSEDGTLTPVKPAEAVVEEEIPPAV